jgi:hypothetical protein
MDAKHAMCDAYPIYSVEDIANQLVIAHKIWSTGADVREDVFEVKSKAWKSFTIFQ